MNAEQPVSASPDLFPFYLERGIALYQLGHFHKAVTDFRMALRLNWRDEEAAAWIARAENASHRDNNTRSFQVCARAA